MNDTATGSLGGTQAEELFEAGQFEAALRAWQAVADADPDAVRPRARVADCLRALGRFEAARAVLEPIVSANAEQPALLVRLAAAEAGTGDADAALETLERAAAAGARLEMGLDREPAF